MIFFNLLTSVISGGVTTDGMAPGVPTDLIEGNTDNNSTYLRWRAVTDDVSVPTYKVYKDGVFERNAVENEVKILGLTEGNYSFTVSSIDAAGNESAQSSSIVITIPATVTDPIDAITASKGQLALDSTYIDLKGADVREENNMFYLERWEDRSPNANHAIQVDEDKQMEIYPEFKNIWPDVLDDVMFLNQNIVLDSTNGFSVYLSLDILYVNNPIRIIMGSEAGQVSGNIYLYKVGSSTYELRFADENNYIMKFPFSVDYTTGKLIYEVHVDGVGGATLHINGVLVSTITVDPSTWVLKRLSGSSSGQDPYVGFYKGIHTFSSVLTEGEKTTVRDALMERYKI